MKRVISKIWKLFSNANKISLIVSSQNIPAIKLYEKLNFRIVDRGTKRLQMGIEDGIYMIRYKR